MPRNKTLSDETVLAGAMRVMGRHGPDSFTLAAVAAEAGIAPATLMQRFGDKHGLIVRAVEQDNAALYRTLATAPAKPGAASVIALFRILTPPPEVEGGLADQFLWLRLDMRDPALNALARARFAALRKAIEIRLPPLPLAPATAARLIEAQWQGALNQWGLEPKGHLIDYVTASLADWFAAVLS